MSSCSATTTPAPAPAAAKTQSKSAHVNIAFCVSYSGSAFKGSQLQTHHHPLSTVEGMLLSALKKVNLINVDIRYDFELALKQKRAHDDEEAAKKKNEEEEKRAAAKEDDGSELVKKPSSVALSSSSSSAAAALAGVPYKGNRYNVNLPTAPFALPNHLRLGRSSRTDKGVSALSNMININVKEHVWSAFGSVDAACAAINKAIVSTLEEMVQSDNNSEQQQAPELSADLSLVMRVQTAQPVPPSFAGRFAASSRLYRYLLPAFCLDPPNSVRNAPLPGSYLFQRRRGVNDIHADSSSNNNNNNNMSVAQAQEALVRNFQRAADPNAPQWTPNQTNNNNPDEEMLAALHHYQARAKVANDILSEHFVGVHRFHNFTGIERKDGTVQLHSKKTIHACDNEAHRRILRCEVMPVPLMLPASSSSSSQSGEQLFAPYFVLQWHGASFILHQIRKMSGALIAVVRGAARSSTIADALSPDKLAVVPMAPARYLALTRVVFDKFDKSQERCGNTRFPVVSETIRRVGDALDEFEYRSVFAEMAHLDSTGKSMWPAMVEAIGEIGSDNLQSGRAPPAVLAVVAVAADSAAAPVSAQQQQQPHVHSEMRKFVKAVSVHNWNIHDNPPQYRPVHGQHAARKQAVKRRGRGEEEGEASGEQECDKKLRNVEGGDDDDVQQSNSGGDDDDNEADENDDGADGEEAPGLSNTAAADSGSEAWMTLGRLVKLNLLAI